MRPTLTPRPLLRELAALVARRFRRACEDTGVSLAAVAHAMDRSPTVVERWASEADDCHHLPAHVLAHRSAIPDALFERLVADLRTLREVQTSETTTSSEAAAAALVSRTGDLLAELGRALADVRISASEARSLRPPARRAQAPDRARGPCPRQHGGIMNALDALGYAWALALALLVVAFVAKRIGGRRG